MAVSRSRHAERAIVGDRMTEEIRRKLTAEIEKGITTEPQVVYLMAGIRKLIERDGLGDEYEALKFHCDWVLHSKLEGRAARTILNLFDKAEHIKRDNVSYKDLPNSLQKKIDRISAMRQFETELYSFLERYGLPRLTIGGGDGWTYFLRLYSQVIQDIPLMIGSPRSRTHREPIPTPAHISHINVRCQLATKPLEFDGTKEMLFRIWWTLHLVDKEPESFYIASSYTMLPDDVFRTTTE